MACLALKRPCEFDSMYGLSPSKRARYAAGPVSTITVTAPDCLPQFAELRRKMTPKKVASPATTYHQEARGHRLGRQLKFDAPVPRTPEFNFNGDQFEENKDKPLFTFSQLKLICERRLKEQAQSIREDYERMLQDKLAEQYDTFVKFTHDQIMRNNHKPDELPGYMT